MSSFMLSSWSALSTTTVVIVGLATILIAAIWLLPREKLDSREPPLAKSRIPLVGHMINLLWYHNTYFSILHKTQPSPITTLLIFTQRIYIISSPTLAQLAFRLSKTIDFEVIKQTASSKAVGFNQHATDIIKSPLVPDPQIPGRMSNYMTDLHTEMYGALAQGRQLLETNARVLGCLVRSLNEVGEDWEEKMMFEWLRGFYTTASAEALYGEENPVKWDNRFIQWVWDFEKDLGLLAMDFYPSLTARKGHFARTTAMPFFESYYAQGLLKNASAFVQGRARCARKWGLSTQEISKAEISILFAAVTNTVPNVFYMLCWIFERPTLVSSLRDEISGIVRKGERDGEMVLDIEGLREKCPLLTACFHESLRLVKTGFSIRMVLEDTMLADEYLLKKGAIVQIPTGVLQADAQTWGPDAEAFDPHRWLDGIYESSSGLANGEIPNGATDGNGKSDVYKSKEKRKSQSSAFIPFGGGKNLCPGRHLAYNEIAAFVAVVVFGFEIEGVDGKERALVKAPEMAINRLGDGSSSPRGDVRIRIRRREGLEGVGWGFVVGGDGD
ncbi:cytochrome P450 [Cadophora sp. MPI-SDFR-AT-0126]|nr:cytochrome P450 [Leotiomycetes sp. MPI-SDFR-AT-0126]